MWQRVRNHLGLVSFVGAYYVGFLGLGVVTDNTEVVFYAGFIALAFLGFVYWDSRRHFSKLVLWGVALWGAMHMAGGMIPIDGAPLLYNVQLLSFLRFDQLVHVVGFGFAGLAFWESVGPHAGSGALMALMGLGSALSMR